MGKCPAGISEGSVRGKYPALICAFVTRLCCE